MHAPGPDRIIVAGAREHNLRNVDLDIPRDALVVFTGLSGSGKSSLAFDTIYQEGQRRYLESLSSYARQFLGRMDKPDVDRVTGLSPTLSIDQRTVSRNPRSTVGTVTEILDHLRLLMARLGTPHCPECATAITALSPGKIATAMGAHRPGARIQVLAPIVRDRKGEYQKELEKLRKAGWIRARIDGEIRSLDEDIPLARYEKHTLEVIVDRLAAVPEEHNRLLEAVELALKMANGTVGVLVAKGDDWEHLTYSSERACPDHPHLSLPELEPRLFSFNTPQGACPSCNGLGRLEGFVPERMVDPDAKLPRALLPLGANGKIPFSSVTDAVVVDIAKCLGADLRKRWKHQPEAVQAGLLHGDCPPMDYRYKDERRAGRVAKITRSWQGLVRTVEHVYHFTHHKPLDVYRQRTTCPACDGVRLAPIPRAVRFRGLGISDLAGMTVADAHGFFSTLKLKGAEKAIGGPIAKEILERLGFLEKVGLNYLALDRPATTLAGGEAQRIRLAAQVGSGLQGVTYVLDEPSIGLHPRDNEKLLDTLVDLRDRGNSVLVVEHDETTIGRADWVVDIGPGAGVEGGRVMASGTPAKVRKARTLTGAYLRREAFIPVPEKRRPGNGEYLTIQGAHAHNLQAVDVSLPLGVFGVLTGVSGSGKSTLMMEVLHKALRHAEGKGEAPELTGFSGAEAIDKVIVIDQSPIGRTPRSNPATYTGAFDGIRTLFARVPEARARGYKPGRFSFNVAGGRCEECAGAGVKTVEMQLLADVQVICESCQGRRFNAETLEIRYRGQTITDILEMSIAEGAEFFSNHRKIHRILATLERVGMGYVKLGQPSTTLSGGEAQRIKLASELHRPATGRTLYLLDEPTTGLHFHDVKALLEALDSLVESGNTVLVIEHNLDVIKVADHLVDMGPEGGVGGGRVVGQGTPEDIARLDTPTGQVLAELPELGGVAPKKKRRARRSRTRETDLIVEGARCHNLKGIDVRIPAGSMTVVTGVSGSGKTSLAFDTLFSEGQRRYVECLSTYARRFLGRLDRPPTDRVEGLAPAIAIQQRASPHNPRSTVATVAEIYDYLRLLWSRIGHRHCPDCSTPIHGYGPSSGAAHLKSMARGTGWVLAPLAPQTDGKEVAADLLKSGFLRLLDGSDGKAPPVEVELDEAPAGKLLEAGTFLVVDRVQLDRVARSRLAEALATAFRYGRNRAIFRPRSGGEDQVLWALPACPTHGPMASEVLSPRHFSFNSAVGACSTCDGLGKTREPMPERVLPHPEKPLVEGLDARVGAVFSRSARIMGQLKALTRHLKVSLENPVSSWSAAARTAFMEGLPGVTLTVKWTKRWGRSRRSTTETLEWKGALAIINGWQGKMEWLRDEQDCTACGGGRLRREALAVTLGGETIAQHCHHTVSKAHHFWKEVSLDPSESQVAEQALREVTSRLKFLEDVGLGYLALDRVAGSLSGGESQRIRLASQLGSGLTGCIYVLDEPTVGLHSRDTKRLLETLHGLRDLGNTLVVVEHDLETICAADRVLDLGPGAGEEGGHLVAEGTPKELEENEASLTGAYLSGRRSVPRPLHSREGGPPIRIRGASAHNLKGVDLDLPTGALTVVTGVSGSGKSSLIMDTLVPALTDHLAGLPSHAPCASLGVPDFVRKLTVVNQRPISRSLRSTPVSYTKVLDHLRNLYATTRTARENGWTRSRFSYNNKEGRCRTCEGLGDIQVEMHFLSDVRIRCEDCRGHRFEPRTLTARWKGLSISDALELRVDGALAHFSSHKRIVRPLQALQDVGLGYLRLGQPAKTLSGGEAQRVKLASALISKGAGAVYVLDEPTTGLHSADVERLVEVLHRLVDAGATMVVVEHNPDVIKNADFVVDMGPEGGEEGGTIVAQGTPERVAATGTHTGQVLQSTLS